MKNSAIRDVGIGLILGCCFGFVLYFSLYEEDRYHQSSAFIGTLPASSSSALRSSSSSGIPLSSTVEAEPICQCVFQLFDRPSSTTRGRGQICPRKERDYLAVAAKNDVFEKDGALSLPFSKGPAAVPATAQLWEHMRGELLEYTIADVEAFLESPNNPDIRAAFARYMRLFSNSRMRRSLIHPMAERDAKNLLQVIKRRLEDPGSNPPLHIVALGGSVTEGVDASLHQFPNAKKKSSFPQQVESAWPRRLENVLNHVVFNGRKVVTVSNMGTGGISSDVASPAVYYGLLPKHIPVTGPDMFLVAFTNNDVGPTRNEAQRLHISEQLIMAIRHLRCEGSPVPVFVEEPYWRDWGQVKYHATLAKTTRWHDAMGISWGKAFNDLMYSTRNMTADEGQSVPWWYGAKANSVHPGIVYHATLPWMIVFNFMQSLLEYCQEPEDSAMSLIKDLSSDEYDGGMDVEMMPEIVAFKEPGYLLDEWVEFQRQRNERCASEDASPATCSYAWMVGKLTGLENADRVGEYITTHMVPGGFGWDIEKLTSTSGRQRAGWSALRANATFVIEVEPKAGKKINYVTIIYIKSYGPKWSGTQLKVKLDVVRKSDNKVAFNSTTITDLVGHHASGTSVSYVEKIPLAKSASGTEKVRATFKLVGGNVFTIKGLLFCED